MRDDAASRFLFWVFRIVELNIVLPMSRLTIRYKGERGCDNPYQYMSQYSWNEE